LAVGAYELKVVAYDAAGNSTESPVRVAVITEGSVSDWVSPAAKAFHLVSDFGEGTYKSGLKMYLHVPAEMPENAPVVLVMHGCQQTATGFRGDTGWTDLADKYKFYVIFAEMNKTQSDANQSGNSYGCFNWAGYYGRNFARNTGDSASLLQMVKFVQEHNDYQAGDAYVTGLSAGGGMAAVMGAFYPDVFKGVAPMAAPVFGCATYEANGSKTPLGTATENAAYDCMGITSSFSPRSGAGCTSGVACMNPTKKRDGEMWAKHVADMGPANYTGEYPKVITWIGTKDQLVDPIHTDNHVQQWTRVFGIDQTADNSTKVIKDGGREHVYNEYHKDGEPVLATVVIQNMGHGIAVDPGTGEDQGGTGATTDCYGLFCSWKTAVGIHSSYYTARFWGLTGGSNNSGSVSVSITSPTANQVVDVDSTVTIAATATDDLLGVSFVEFYAAGELVCSDSTAPYTCDWATNGIASGTKVALQVIAYNNVAYEQATQTVSVWVGEQVFECKEYSATMYAHRTATPARATLEGTCSAWSSADCTYILTGSEEVMKVPGNQAASTNYTLRETAENYFESGTCN
jgi:poly(hydroxyalkanoate) depolymerase family esterase